MRIRVSLFIAGSIFAGIARAANLVPNLAAVVINVGARDCDRMAGLLGAPEAVRMLSRSRPLAQRVPRMEPLVKRRRSHG